MANELPGSLLVTFTRQGFMAQGLAAMRPRNAMILAFTPSLDTLRQLGMLRGVETYLMTFSADPDVTIENAVQYLKRHSRVSTGTKLIIVTDILSQDRLVDSIQLRTVN